MTEPREPFDLDAYELRVQQGPCFICGLAEGDARLRSVNYMIYEDDDILVFLNRYPTLRGYTLVCPRRHVERLVDDLSEADYLHLQRWVYRVGAAVQQVVPTERLYVLSLGSQQGNRHIHWHVAPLPRGVAYREQQLGALSISRGVLAIPAEEMASLAMQIRTHLVR